MNYNELFQLYFSTFVSKEVPHFLAEYVAEVLTERDLNNVIPSDIDFLYIAEVQHIVGIRPTLPPDHVVLPSPEPVDGTCLDSGVTS